MNIQEEKIYLEARINYLKEQTNNVEKDFHKLSISDDDWYYNKNIKKEDLIRWSYIANKRQLENEIINMKRYLGLVDLKVKLDLHLNDDNQEQKELKGLIFEIIDNYRNMITEDDGR